MNLDEGCRELVTQSRGFLSHIHRFNMHFMKHNNGSSPSLRRRYVTETSWLVVLAILMVVYVFRHVLNRAMASDAVIDTDSTMVTVVASG